MPTTKPRVAITLDHETYELIAKFAELQSKSKARVCAEMIQGAAPFLRTPIEILEKSKNAPDDFNRKLAALFEELESDILAGMDKSLQGDIFGRDH